MSGPSTPRRRSFHLRTAAALAAALAFGTSGCGGGTRPGGAEGAPGLALVSFLQSGQDNVPVNRILEFDFASPIDPDTVDSTSIQIRSGDQFGMAVEGRYVVQGSRVFFEPKLPGLCDLSDGGLRPNTTYHVSVIGKPEEFAVRSLGGVPLPATVSAAFHTRIETDPSLFEDQVPGQAPTVTGTSPSDGAWPDAPSAGLSTHPEVYIGPANKVVIDFSENIDPCSVSPDTVTFLQYAVGDQPTRPNGFLPGGDVTPGDPFTWGSGTATSPPRRVRSNYVLTQSFLSTRLEITPVFGEFPDNSLLVVQVTNLVHDFGGHPLLPKSFAFVTENRVTQNGTKVFEFLGETPIDANLTTADVNTPRAVGKAEGFVLYAGDGDNGALPTRASNPDTANGPAGCATPPGIPQANDGIPDDFDTLTFGGDVNLDTGSTLNGCKNSTDGSQAVVFEFRTFHIRNGHTVRVVGRNPAILLVHGDVLIESGGSLLVKGDGGNGSPKANGTSSLSGDTVNRAPGGTGTAGGGDGGVGENVTNGKIYSGNGAAGYGSPDYDGPPFSVAGTKPAGVGGTDPVRQGPGRGAVSLAWNYGAPYNNNMQGASGGGGGHAVSGTGGAAVNLGGNVTHYLDDAFFDGSAGGTYGSTNGKMLQPEAGSGGGGSGYSRPGPYTTGTYSCSGAGGGAGGGFLDVTAQGNITVLGTIDASGGRGGTGSSFSYYIASGGGGGGSGGGIRLLTPQSIVLGPTTTLTAAGGQGGAGAQAIYPSGQPQGPANNGGAGGNGRIVLEDSDSVVTNYGAALVVPGDGAQGFYRGVFDATRFQGGGLTPQMTTGLIDVGPTSPGYTTPVQSYGVQEDFAASIPLVASRGVNMVSMFVEIQGFPAKADGTADLLAGTGWKSVGTFVDSGSAPFPTWVAGTPAVGGGALQVPSLPTGNTGGSIASVSGREFIKFRVTYYLKPGMGPFDEGPAIDRWSLRYSYDQ